jgi:sporulation protein YlmC with PRC-barrel domain
MFVYFSSLMDKPVYDKHGAFAGKIYDIIVRPSEVYPVSVALIIRKGSLNKKYASVPWAEIQELDDKEARLNVGRSHVYFEQRHDNKEEFSLRRDILDQQVVDTYNHKVIRINDIHLLFVDHSVMAAHVDISLRGLIRRLGYEKIVDTIVGIFNRNSDYLNKEHLISWKYVQPLTINPASMTIKVAVPYKQFNAIPAADLGDIFLDLDMKQKVALFKSLDTKTRARVFMNVDFKTQRSLIDELGNNDIAEMLYNIPTDEATDFLERLPKRDVVQLLALIETKYSKKLSQLLGFANDSAGGLMTTEYMAFAKGSPVDSVLQQIREREFKVEPAQFVYVIDDAGHLVGATNFRRLMLAQPQDLIENVTFPKTYFVNIGSSVKEVAYLMEKYKYYAIPVVDDSNVLQGIITVDDILSQLISIAWRRLKRIRVQPKQ